MERAKQTFCTMAVILFTALSVYNTQREVPENETKYADYAMSYLAYVGICFIVVLIVNLLKCSNRTIKACYLFSIVVYASLGWKAFNKTVGAHNDYDITLIGIGAIVSFIYLVKPYSKDLLLLCKTIINQIYALCQRTKPKGK